MSFIDISTLQLYLLWKIDFDKFQSILHRSSARLEEKWMFINANSISKWLNMFDEI